LELLEGLIFLVEVFKNADWEIGVILFLAIRIIS